MRSKTRLATFLMTFIAVLGLISPAAGAAEQPLTNSEIVSMIKAGLGDDLVIAKIASAKSVELDVASDALIALKKAGVSAQVMDAMLRRSAGSTYASPGQGESSKSTRLKTGARLVTKNGEFDLMSIAGAASSTFIGVGYLWWNNYPGTAAEARTADTEATLLVESEKSPVGRFYIVRMDSNPKNNDRSLKMGKTGMFTQRMMSNPDNTWSIPFEVIRLGDELWRLKPRTPLPPDEYGLWISTGELYDFAVDFASQ